LVQVPVRGLSGIFPFQKDYGRAESDCEKNKFIAQELFFMTNRLDLSQMRSEMLEHVLSQDDETYSSLKAEPKALGTNASAVAYEGWMRHSDITLEVLVIASVDSSGNALRRSGLERKEAGKFIHMSLGTVYKASTGIRGELLS
jgi:hypothetical protein